MNLKPIIYDPNGKISQSKIWTNIAFTVASYVVIKLANENSIFIGEVFLWYLVIVSGSELGKKFMTMKLSKEQTKRGKEE
jgi:hypothetical protein